MRKLNEDDIKLTSESTYPEIINSWERVGFVFEFEDDEIDGEVLYRDDRDRSDWHIDIKRTLWGSDWVAEAWSDPYDDGTGKGFEIAKGDLSEVVEAVLEKISDPDFAGTLPIW